MSIISSILGGGLSSAVDSVAGLARVFVGDKSEKESNIHDEQIAANEALTAEAQAQSREARTGWDSFVDGLNRLPRPLGFFGVLGMMIWCPLNPSAFSNAMIAYQLVPEWLALVFAQVLALYFGGRMLEKWNMKPVDPKVQASVLAQLKAAKTSEESPNTTRTNNSGVGQSAVEPLSAARPISEDQYKKEMKDTSRPLSLDAIVEWNKRNQK